MDEGHRQVLLLHSCLRCGVPVLAHAPASAYHTMPGANPSPLPRPPIPPCSDGPDGQVYATARALFVAPKPHKMVQVRGGRLGCCLCGVCTAGVSKACWVGSRRAAAGADVWGHPSSAAGPSNRGWV